MIKLILILLIIYLTIKFIKVMSGNNNKKNQVMWFCKRCGHAFEYIEERTSLPDCCPKCGQTIDNRRIGYGDVERKIRR